METLVKSVQNQLRATYEGRDIVLVGDVAAGATGRVELLQQLGAGRILVIAGGRGTGPLPDELGAELHMYDPGPSADMVDSFRNEERVFADPPTDVCEVLHAFDPDRTALVIAPMFYAVQRFGDRVLFGARRPEWIALEDKTLNDALFDRVDLARPPSRIVAADSDAIDAAARDLDEGAGTVWAGDARGGFNGGGVFVRWVRDAGDRDEALAFLIPRCDTVRVAPFVEGIPCSVHGFVTGDGVAVFRAVELVTLRASTRPHLRYCGAATFFDPPASDLATMRASVRRVGDALRADVDFRGAFTVDGILGADGWVATECNPRFGAALGYVHALLPELALPALNYAITAGTADVPAAELEEVVMTIAAAQRWGGVWTPVACAIADSVTIEIDAGSFSMGPSAMGGFMRVSFDAERTPAGPSIAARGAAALAWATAEYDLGLPALEPAQLIR